MDNAVKPCGIKIHHFGSLFEISALSLISHLGDVIQRPLPPVVTMKHPLDSHV